jgi:seryl-tRNA synthetase
MLDIKLIRENPDIIRKDLQKRMKPEKLALVDELLKMEKNKMENNEQEAKKETLTTTESSKSNSLSVAQNELHISSLNLAQTSENPIKSPRNHQ